jgi:hypothetical protein
VGEDGFTDLSLSPRARDMALWLCDLANDALNRRSRAASAEMLLRELPDHWTAEDVEREAREVRMKLGPKASRRAWLDAMGWLVGEREQLPEKPHHVVTEYTRLALSRMVRDTLASFATKPTAAPKSDEAKRLSDNAAWAASVLAAVQKQARP